MCEDHSPPAPMRAVLHEVEVKQPITLEPGLPGSPGDALGGGFGRLADGSGIAGFRRAGWAGGFR
jgi:hypothetical protein